MDRAYLEELLLDEDVDLVTKIECVRKIASADVALAALLAQYSDADPITRQRVEQRLPTLLGAEDQVVEAKELIAVIKALEANDSDRWGPGIGYEE